MFNDDRRWVRVLANMAVIAVLLGVVLLARYQVQRARCHSLAERTGLVADYEWSGCILTGSETVVVDA